MQRAKNEALKTELTDGLNRKSGHFNFFPKNQDFLTFKYKIFLKIPGRPLK
jgi:hypothetical protein